MTLVLLDSGISNLASVAGAFERVGAPTRRVDDAAGMAGATAIVLPGVGAFGDGMASLREKRLIDPLRAAASAGVPILGICLGMQLLAEDSEEHGSHTGLGLVPGRVVRLVADRPGFRVPNIGWCDVAASRASVLFGSAPTPRPFYFVHSFHLKSAHPDLVIANISFCGRSVPVALEYGNIFGVQFHPEKSQDAGLDLLASFIGYLRQRGL